MILKEIIQYVISQRKWWLAPIVFLLFLVALFVFLQIQQLHHSFILYFSYEMSEAFFLHCEQGYGYTFNANPICCFGDISSVSYGK